MSLHTTLHLHNVAADREADYAQWFDGKHLEDLARLRGFLSADRYEVTREQIMPDIPQPWRFMSVYEFDYPAPEIDLPALGPLLAEARDAGMIDDAGETERIHSYAMYSDWVSSPNHQKDKPFFRREHHPGQLRGRARGRVSQVVQRSARPRGHARSPARSR
jgi:hypothetical protein